MSDTVLDLIKVVNDDTKPLVLNGNTRYEIDPGASRVLRFDDAAAWFGDPRLVDDGRENMRQMAFRQTQMLWGYSEGMKYPVDWDDQSKGFANWDEHFKPKVRCFDMDDKEVFFIIHDPEGTKTPANAPAHLDPARIDPMALLAQMQGMQQQIATLTAALAGAGAAPAASPAAAPDPAIVDAQVGALPEPDPNEAVGDDAPRTVRSGGKSK